MWINIIGENFKDLLETLKQKPFVIVVIGLLWVSGFFISKWTSSKDGCVDELKKKNDDIVVLHDSISRYKYESLYYQKLYKTSIDSINKSIRERIVKPLENQKQND